MLSTRSSISASATAQINTQVQELKRQGVLIYNLSLGDPAVPNDPVILAAAQAAVERNQNSYPPTPGFGELRSAASAWINGEYGTTYSPEQTLVTSGGKFGIFLSLQALLNQGDEVIVLAPYWVSYPSMIQLFDGQMKVVHAKEENHWKILPEDLARACSSKTKAVIINNACNPSGALYTHAELEKLLSVLPSHTWILADEVYSGLTYDGQPYASCGQFPEYADRTVIIQSCSKNFGMTGWRVGFVFGAASFIEALTKLQGQSLTSTAGVCQWAALGALQDARRIQNNLRSALEHRRNVFIDGLQQYFGALPKPASAIYSLIPLRYFGVQHDDDVLFCQTLLAKAHLALIPGSAFGKPGTVRCAFGETPEHLTACIDRLGEYFEVHSRE